jgi:Protein of unknown function (DUF3617)
MLFTRIYFLAGLLFPVIIYAQTTPSTSKAVSSAAKKQLTPAEPKLGPAKITSQAGLWETVITTEYSNGSTGKGDMLTCILPKDLRTPEVIIPVYSEVGMNCRNEGFKLSNGTAAWQITCQGAKGSSIKGKGSLVFSPTVYKGSVKIEKITPTANITMQQKINANYVGPCKY